MLYYFHGRKQSIHPPHPTIIQPLVGVIPPPVGVVRPLVGVIPPLVGVIRPLVGVVWPLILTGAIGSPQVPVRTFPVFQTQAAEQLRCLRHPKLTHCPTGFT
ncbi:MAG: hypothetical protein WA821_02980 [Anaerolineales bacterium]